MAKPRVFISSTYYDLKEIRASLAAFVESLGFEAILSERGDIPYVPGKELDDSCYAEVANVDIFVILVGRRYGSAASKQEEPATPEELDYYESVTKQEFDEAAQRSIPIYILVDKEIATEYQTYLNNDKSLKPAFAESLNVYRLLDHLEDQQVRRAQSQFSSFDELSSWLRDQWAGWFRDLLHRESSQLQLARLTDQVVALEQIGTQLALNVKKLSEKLLEPPDREELAKEQAARVEEALQNDVFASALRHLLDYDNKDIRVVMSIASTPVELLEQLYTGVAPTDHRLVQELNYWIISRRGDINRTRAILSLPPYPYGSIDSDGSYIGKVHLHESRTTDSQPNIFGSGPFSAFDKDVNVTHGSAELPTDEDGQTST